MAILLDAILLDKGLVDGDRVALLINGLGGTPPMELDIVARAALSQLRAKGLVVERAWSGNFVTSLEIPGCSLSLLTLDDARIAQLDAPARAPAWPGSGHIGLTGNRVASPEAPVDTRATPTPGPLSGALKKAVLAVAASLTGAETGLAQLDAEAGDGDLGASMARGAEAMRDLPDAAFASPEILLEALGHALLRAIACSSGPFIGPRQLFGRPSRRHPRPRAVAVSIWMEALIPFTG